MIKGDQTYERIDSLIHLEKYLDTMKAFTSLLVDIKHDEPFDNEDIVKYVALRMREMADEIFPEEL
jgi:hypothetical protein